MYSKCHGLSDTHVTIADRVTDSYARFYRSGSLWQEFQMLELSEVMCQKDDHSFVDLLGRVPMYS